VLLFLCGFKRMPDYGRSAGDVVERLERTLNRYPAPDYGSTLLGVGHLPSGGRKLNGGIMMRPGYKGPTVNIRPPKWTDNSFWIGAESYPAAKYIADAVYYFTGRGPFHFTDVSFPYPPLRLATGELLTREACAVYVESIAKGAEHQKQREDYREKVKDVVLKAVKSPEAVLFLNSLRPAASSNGAAEESETSDGANEAGSVEEDSEGVSVGENVVDEVVAEDGVGNNVGDEFAEQATPMEVDHVSEQAIQGLWEPVAATSGYIPTFGIASASLDSHILQSDWLSLDGGLHHLGTEAEENTFSCFLNELDKGEKEAYKSIKRAAWVQWCPQRNA
jgi:hypothetical protein